MGVPYSFSFTAAGDAGITFSLTGGALPPGLVLAADGLLSGTPTTAGTYAFVVKATGSGSSAEQNATVTIVAYVVSGGLMVLAGLVLLSVARRRTGAPRPSVIAPPR